MAEDEYGMEIDDLDEEEREMFEEASTKPKAKRKKALETLKKKSNRPTARFAAFSNPPRTGIYDNETKEILAEGEMTSLVVLANILERLERIEYKIGNILEE